MMNSAGSRFGPRSILLCAVLCVIGQVAAVSQPMAPAVKRPVEIGIDQKLGERIPPALTFRDESGQTVRIEQYLGKKPIILSLVYYECPMLCTQALNGLLRSLKQLNFSAGEEFTVLTVSFDPREKPALAAAKQRTYLALYNRQSAWQGWHFLTGEQEAIAKLTETVGFRYKWDDASSQFAHATGIIVLTPDGIISRYLYGINYRSTDVRLALVEASAEKIGSPVDQLLLLCYHYDPVQGKYGLVITRLLQIGGAITVVVLGAAIVLFLRREKRATRRGPRPHF